MARLSQFSIFSRSLRAQAILDALAGGKLRIYSGAMPANGEAAPAGNLLVEFDLATPAGVETDGVIAFTNPGVELGVLAGNASVATLVTAGGDRLGNFNVGPSGADGYIIELDDVSIEIGGEVEVTSLEWEEPETGE